MTALTTTTTRATDDNLENELLFCPLASPFNGGGDDDKEDDVLEKNVCDSSTSLLLVVVAKAPPLLDVPPSLRCWIYPSKVMLICSAISQIDHSHHFVVVVSMMILHYHHHHHFHFHRHHSKPTRPIEHTPPLKFNLQRIWNALPWPMLDTSISPS